MCVCVCLCACAYTLRNALLSTARGGAASLVSQERAGAHTPPPLPGRVDKCPVLPRRLMDREEFTPAEFMLN